MNAYADDEEVGRVTRQIVNSGHSILQIFKLAGNDADHVAALLDLFIPSEGARVLDLGCGVGAVADIMHRMRPDLEFTLSNISAAQLSMCPERFTCIHGDMGHIQAGSASFEGVMALYSIGHGDLNTVMSEAARVLTPGGVFFIYDLAAEDGDRLHETLNYKAHRQEDVTRAAELHGFSVDGFGDPGPTTTDQFMSVMDAETFAHVFQGVTPVYYRLTNRPPMVANLNCME